MGSLRAASDDRLAADLLWQMKAIATKEVAATSSSKSRSNIISITPKKRKTTFVLPRIISTISPSISSYESLEDSSSVLSSYSSPTAINSSSISSSSSTIRRSRTVSVGSIDMILPSQDNPHSTRILIKLSPRPTIRRTDLHAADHLEHFDWSQRRAPPAPAEKHKASSLLRVESSPPPSSPPPLDDLGGNNNNKHQGNSKNSKRKREGFVGQAQTPEIAVRGTLRKKFSWKQYPELEEYLLSKQCEYFEYSSKNYTAEQRKYNNGLTRGLLDLAADEGYVFQDFTFSMIRDRIRCYYKSHSQLAKKKRQR